jgi:glycosyltransferase involved in cell wall biosynthesis
MNPMQSGSGTNLKMLDYFAAGLPVVTTERGSRGLRLEGESVCLVREIDAFPAAIRDVVGAGADAAQRRSLAARERVERDFDWDAIARRIKPRLLAMTGGAF